MKTPELLAPAGNYEKLSTALHYGADAVYMGLSDFSLRAKADNFTFDELEKAVRLVHGKGKKIYITINIFPHNRDISRLKEHLLSLKAISPDALIISDPGVFTAVSEIVPDIPIHISTQANRLVLSRELTIGEIREIRDHVSLELECFVHGSLCISYSGKCYISSFLANRSANRGECTNSCRWRYTLSEEKRPGEHYPVYEDDRGTYVLSSKDLCMIEYLDRLADGGIDCFKIEGRMKGINYVAGVVKTYRDAVNSLKEKPYRVKEQWLRELSMVSSRGYTTGMFFHEQEEYSYNHDEEDAYRMNHELVGIVQSIKNGVAAVALRNTLQIGDTIKFLSPGLENRTFGVMEIHDVRGNSIETGRNEDIVFLPVEEGVRENDLIRRPLQLHHESWGGSS
jgi:putative protease